MNLNNLNHESNRASQPKGLKIKLRNHQLTSIAAMLEFESQSCVLIDKLSEISPLGNMIYNRRVCDLNQFRNSTFNLETNFGILGDKVGSGKTYMIIGLILHSKIPPQHNKIVLGSNYFSVKMLPEENNISPNLIVVPHNLTYQWIEFLENSKLKFLRLNTEHDFDCFFDIDYIDEPDVEHEDDVITFHKVIVNKTIKGKQNIKLSKNSDTIVQRMRLNKDKVAEVLETIDAIVLNINRYNLFSQIFGSITWARVIVDEIAAIKIPRSFNQHGHFNWYITATPSLIADSHNSYVSKVFEDCEEIMEYITVKNEDKYVDESIKLPQPFVFIINAKLNRTVSAFINFIPTEVLNLINAGNMKEALVKLNCNVDTKENIVTVLTKNTNTELHNLKQELIYMKSLIPNNEDQYKKQLEKLQNKIKSCETRINSINEKVASIKDECCIICTDPFDTPTITDCCKTIFCFACLMMCIKNGSLCPYCRQKMDVKKGYHVIESGAITKNSKSKPKNSQFREMEKKEILENILSYISKTDENPKILIFSDYSETFDKITKGISKANLKHSVLSGTSRRISNIVSKFNEGEINILMLNSSNYGSGLNLQTANYIIIYHRMDSGMEEQIIGRAQRDGRNKELRIIYLINSSEKCKIKLTDNPYCVDNKDELWMITNPTLNKSENTIPTKKIKKKYIEI